MAALELVDLVDSTGQVQKTGVPRHEVDSHSGLHMQIAIVVVRHSLDGRILAHRRAAAKSVDPGHIDHICGAVMSGETPEEAAVREALEETGVELRDIRMAHQAVNEYGRFRHLLVADADSEPAATDLNEVMWAGWLHLNYLHGMRSSGELFVGGYFEDIELALGALKAET